MSFLTWLKDFFLTADRNAPPANSLYYAGFSSAAAAKHGSVHDKTASSGKFHDDDDDITDPLNPFNPLSSLHPFSSLKSVTQTAQTDVMTDGFYS